MSINNDNNSVSPPNDFDPFRNPSEDNILDSLFNYFKYNDISCNEIESFIVYYCILLYTYYSYCELAILPEEEHETWAMWKAPGRMEGSWSPPRMDR